MRTDNVRKVRKHIRNDDRGNRLRSGRPNSDPPDLAHCPDWSPLGPRGGQGRSSTNSLRPYLLPKSRARVQKVLEDGRSPGPGLKRSCSSKPGPLKAVRCAGATARMDGERSFAAHSTNGRTADQADLILKPVIRRSFLKQHNCAFAICESSSKLQISRFAIFETR